MCGITGFLNLDKPIYYNQKQVIKDMCKAINHRGPDESDIYIDTKEKVFLGHTRLSILELSSLGSQPMCSKSGRYVIVFNGEIYNHLEIRKEIVSSQNLSWMGNSDTETLLSAIEVYGIKLALKKCVGMFSFALWDKIERKLTISIDRMGEKPMYYGIQNNAFIFGSELKSLVLHPDFLQEENINSLSTYLNLGYIPRPFSIWQGVKKLNPAEIITINIGSNNIFNLKTDSYWSLSEKIIESQKNNFHGSTKHAIENLEHLIINSVKGQMLSDVPIGAFLSGGIDSSLVVSVMQSITNNPVKTFSIGFENKKYNEANFAKSVASHLKTDHTELYVNDKDALDVIPLLSQIYDEPFGDSSAIPTFLVSKLARNHVSVCLSGDGGDELFGGYSRYQNSKFKLLNKIPNCFFEFSHNIFKNIPAKNMIFGEKFIDKVNFANDLSQTRDFKSFYNTSISQWRNSPLVNSVIDQDFGISNYIVDMIKDPMHKMMAIDSLTYLPDDILTKVDRAAMAVSLETRVPLLDHRIVEYAWQLPGSLKFNDGQMKWILKEILSKYVPRQLTERPKMGFGIPIASWLRGPLRDWAESLLDSKIIKSEGIFNNKIISRNWNQFLKGDDRLSHPMWLILTYQSWKNSQKFN